MVRMKAGMAAVLPRAGFWGDRAMTWDSGTSNLAQVRADASAPLAKANMVGGTEYVLQLSNMETHFRYNIAQ